MPDDQLEDESRIDAAWRGIVAKVYREAAASAKSPEEESLILFRVCAALMQSFETQVATAYLRKKLFPSERG